MHMPLSLIANVRAARNAHTETVHSGSPSVLVGWVSRTREGGKLPLPASFAARALLRIPRGRPITGATYKHVLHVKLAVYTLTLVFCSSPVVKRNGAANKANVHNTHRGARAHDHKVKSLALCRLS